MGNTTRLEWTLGVLKRLIPSFLFRAFAPGYHFVLAWLAAFWYGFPSRSLTVIGVTGSKGKSTTVFLITRIFEAANMPVASIGSLGVRIAGKDLKNRWGNTMPGRFALQRFLYEAKKAGARYAVLEVTSEGIASYRHKAIRFNAAVLTNLEREHIERHGSFENYRAAKGELFNAAKPLHILNADDSSFDYFRRYKTERIRSFGLEHGDIRAEHVRHDAVSSTFFALGRDFTVNLPGMFNVYNALAVLAVADSYAINLALAAEALLKIKKIPGRFEEIIPEGGTDIRVIVDYAHTPRSLKAVYQTAREGLGATTGKLIAILGAAGGGRDRWKRPEFGKLAAAFCDQIILTNEDPYDEDPVGILKEILAAIPESRQAEIVLDRGEAIRRAILEAAPQDTVIMTGKGSEEVIHIARGVNIPWSDRAMALKALKERQGQRIANSDICIFVLHL